MVPADEPLLAESFVPGFEVALEGLLGHGKLEVLALFDKPDPLDGPFFEETIYVTPSRLPAAAQAAIGEATAAAAPRSACAPAQSTRSCASTSAAPELVEIAGRSIGGRCSPSCGSARA